MALFLLYLFFLCFCDLDVCVFVCLSFFSCFCIGDFCVRSFVLKIDIFLFISHLMLRKRTQVVLSLVLPLYSIVSFFSGHEVNKKRERERERKRRGNLC